MPIRSFIVAIAASACCLRSLSADEPVDYVSQIKPILSKNCFACHGPLKQESGLRLDAAQLMKQGGDGGPAVVAGKSSESLLWERITGDETTRMPPADEGEPLKPDEIALVKTWIDQGAPAPADEQPLPHPTEHWAFRKPMRPDVPAVTDADWSRSPIDAFIKARQEHVGLLPQSLALQVVLLRRVYLDLTGLPPTRDELLAFQADDSPEAYARVVERLLASPAYGQRWGRHWMDVWRYSDWYGMNGQDIINSRRHIWQWRDWIIESLNNDKPYDRMLVEMLAGDELAPNDPEVLRATGYLARSYFHFDRNVQMQNTLEHAGKALLGLTLECARCHDHKYDPISQRDYYRFRAIFEPLGVRQDQVPGVANLDEKSLPRVFDAEIETKTFLYKRGDIRQPVEDDPLEPGVPEFFAADLKPAAVSLPPEAHYPGLKPYVQRDTLAAIENEIAQLEQERQRLESVLTKSQDNLDRLASAAEESPAESSDAELQDAGIKLLNARQAVELNEQKTKTSRLRLAEVRHCIAADELKYADAEDRDEEQFRALAVAANRASCESAVAAAEQAVLLARHRLEQEEATGKNDQVKLKLRRDTLEREAEKLAKVQEEFKKAGGPDASHEYKPFVPVHPAESTGRRLALARWIADEHNPLTARVAVNHIWARHFGRPLVPTVFDFGLAGEPPSHPELLDWLAVEFIESGWSMKHLHRLIVTSRTYCLSSTNRGSAQANHDRDPDNRYLWKMNARRMEAEVIRDSMLHLSGRLDPSLGGPEFDTRDSHKVPRRSVYFRHTGEDQLALSQLFDGANVNECYRRNETIIPQQALALANGPVCLEQSCLIARRLSAAESEDQSFITAAFEHLLNRLPKPEEIDACSQFLDDQQSLLSDVAQLKSFESESLGIAPSQDPKLRARESLIHVLFNHNDFVTVR